MVAMINDIVCKQALNGWCDQLGKYPKNYLFTFVLTLIATYGMPIITIGSLLMFSGAVYIESNYLVYFSSVLPSLPVLFIVNATLGVVISGIIVIVINFLYMIYMTRQLGVYVLVPVLIEIIRWIIVIFFKEWFVIAVAISLIPFMTFSVASHFISYTIGKGLTTRR